jgi:hypothetical protein
MDRSRAAVSAALGLARLRQLSRGKDEADASGSLPDFSFFGKPQPDRSFRERFIVSRTAEVSAPDNVSATIQAEYRPLK